MWKNQIYLIWSLGVWFFFFFLDKILYKTLFTTVSVRIQEGASEYNHCTRWPRCSAKRNSGSAIQTQIWIQIQMAAYKYKFQYRYKYKNLVRCSTKRNGGSGIHVCLPAFWHSLPFSASSLLDSFSRTDSPSTTATDVGPLSIWGQIWWRICHQIWW